MITALILGGLIFWFWDDIVSVFQTKFIPWIRENIGDRTADVLAEIVAFADMAKALTVRQVQSAWKWLHCKIISSTSTYEEISPLDYRVTSKMRFRNQDKVSEIVTTREIPLGSLPAEVRNKLIKTSRTEVIDDLDILKHQFKSSAEKQGITLEYTA